MLWRKIISLVCPIACVICLAVGYAPIGQWMALLGVLLNLFAWLFARKGRSELLSLAALVFSLSLTVAGLFASASPYLMILSATLALASWDTALLDHARTEDSPAKTVDLLEKRHYQSLALALGLGLLLAIAGRVLRIQLSFGWMILLAILALFSLERVWRALRGRSN